MSFTIRSLTYTLSEISYSWWCIYGHQNYVKNDTLLWKILLLWCTSVNQIPCMKKTQMFFYVKDNVSKCINWCIVICISWLPLSMKGCHFLHKYFIHISASPGVTYFRNFYPFVDHNGHGWLVWSGTHKMPLCHYLINCITLFLIQFLF